MSNSPQLPRPPARPAGFSWRRLLRVIERALAVAGLVLILYHLGLDLSVVTSGSMAPTLRGSSVTNGDWVLTEKVSFWFRQPRRWEVIAFENEDGVKVMKRVAGLPGETISMRQTQLCINGRPIIRPAALAQLKYYPYGNLAKDQVTNCGSGYFLLGDDSIDSQDSRFEGPLPSAQVRGRAWCILWPPSRIGWVNP